MSYPAALVRKIFHSVEGSCSREVTVYKPVGSFSRNIRENALGRIEKVGDRANTQLLFQWPIALLYHAFTIRLAIEFTSKYLYVHDLKKIDLVIKNRRNI